MLKLESKLYYFRNFPLLLNFAALYSGMRIYIRAMIILFVSLGSFNLSLDFFRNTHSILLYFLWSDLSSDTYPALNDGLYVLVLVRTLVEFLRFCERINPTQTILLVIRRDSKIIRLYHVPILLFRFVSGNGLPFNYLTLHV
jgi:hypothetical protein